MPIPALLLKRRFCARPTSTPSVERSKQVPSRSARPSSCASLTHGLTPNAANDNRLAAWLAPAFAGALAASLAMITLIPTSTQSVVDQEIVSSHVRSLQPGHLTDVQTTNQHIVKPWFNGKIDFSPPVPELADVGFPLAGGRLDSLGGKTVAAIVYHRRLHTVNLYVWPAKDSAERSFVKDGFAVTEWSRNGLRFAAVSDIPPAEVRQFEILFESRSS